MKNTYLSFRFQFLFYFFAFHLISSTLVNFLSFIKEIPSSLVFLSNLLTSFGQFSSWLQSFFTIFCISSSGSSKLNEIKVSAFFKIEVLPSCPAEHRLEMEILNENLIFPFLWFDRCTYLGKWGKEGWTIPI